MTATTLPSDLKYGREQFMAITGLSGNDVGALPDPTHKSGGGYHCGCQDIIDLGRWATAGSSQADYSVRQARDRIGANQCSAHDVGDDWPNGGRAAWIRWNNLLVARMIAGDPALSALRAVNFTPNGTDRRRYDTKNPGAGIIPSTDSVTIHTHLEYWRDTVGTPARKATLDRIAQLMQQAITNNISGGTMNLDTLVMCADGNQRPLWQLILDVWNGVYHGGGEQNPARPAQGGYATQFPRSLYAETKAIKAAVAEIPTDVQVPSEPGDVTVAVETVVAALESEAGQAALVRANNTAEDS